VVSKRLTDTGLTVASQKRVIAAGGIMRAILVMVAVFLFGEAAFAEMHVEPVYLNLRNAALEWKDGLNHPGGLNGLIFEIGTIEGVITLIALRDGTASIYFSNGGGKLGAGQASLDVAKKVDTILALAETYLPSAEPSPAHPLPEAGRSQFYFATAKGVHRIEASTEELTGKHSAAPLFTYSGKLLGAIDAVVP
jgi:hypothetical protein